MQVFTRFRLRDISPIVFLDVQFHVRSNVDSGAVTEDVARMRRVLLADDHPMFRQGLRALLEREGFEVVAEASDGPEAVKLAGQTAPEVAVLDIGMPLMNGIDAARQILKETPDSHVVLLTMY